MVPTPQEPDPTKAHLVIRPNAPFEIESMGADSDRGTADEFKRFAACFRAYRQALRALLAGKFLAYKPILPRHLRGECRVLALWCADGILVRYEPIEAAKSNLSVAVLDATVEHVAPSVSNLLVHIPANPATYVLPSGGMSFVGTATDRETGASRVAFAFEMFVIVERRRLDRQRETRPAFLALVQNELQITTEGERVFADGRVRPDNRFVSRTPVRLDVPWCAIEVYPPTAQEQWDPALASQWAENDVLSAVASHTFSEQKYHQLDSRAELRRKYSKILGDMRALLRGPEEPVHQFLKQVPQLLCPFHLRAWSKHPFGSCFSDFVFLAPHNDYLLVELEAPVRRLFRKDGHPCAELTHAMAQVRDWTRHIQDHKPDVEKALPGISPTPRSLIVIGRSSELTPENRRHLVALETDVPRLKIMTYDDLIEYATATLQHVIGPLDVNIGPESLVYCYTGPSIKPPPP